MILSKVVPAAFAALLMFAATPLANAETVEDAADQFSENDIVQAASGFFGMTTEAVAKAVQKIFSDVACPMPTSRARKVRALSWWACVTASGYLIRKRHKPLKVYWQGPSVGFDIGGNASKNFTLIYNLRRADRLFQKFPGVEGSYYFIAGIGINYQRADEITLAPMRTGVGLRAGVNAGYLTYTREHTLNPF